MCAFDLQKITPTRHLGCHHDHFFKEAWLVVHTLALLKLILLKIQEMMKCLPHTILQSVDCENRASKSLSIQYIAHSCQHATEKMAVSKEANLKSD